MIVFNTFSNGQRIKVLPQMDLLMWAAGLCAYKKLGFETKIYCLPDDIQFLKDNHLYELYDYIDSDYLTRNFHLSRIDNKNFWACRKLEAMYHELVELGNNRFYSDTDIIIDESPDFSGDCIAWSPEPASTNNGTIYPDWSVLSKPPGYKMPEFIEKCPDAYNCGILWFKDKEFYKFYRKLVYKYVMDNPCIIYPNNAGITKDNTAVFMCNAEQRIYKACVQFKNKDIRLFMESKQRGTCLKGRHYYWYRVIWKNLDKVDKSYFLYQDIINQLVFLVRDGVQYIKDYGPKSTYDFYNRDWDTTKYY